MGWQIGFTLREKGLRECKNKRRPTARSLPAQSEEGLGYKRCEGAVGGVRGPTPEARGRDGGKRAANQMEGLFARAKNQK